MARTLTAGEVLSGRFRIERELGRGAMGVVYLATDLPHHREVAVKLLDRVAISPTDVARFRNEIRDAAQLQHPNILAVHDSGEVEGVPFYVMPRVTGETLRARMERMGRMPVGESVRLVHLLAGALGHAHARGVVHRDVKPENVLIDGAGHPYLADFGIARSVARGGRLTGTGIAIGSPTYMSPEQIQGEEALDGRADVYALGCLLFEMLAGDPPFEGPTAPAVLAAHLRDAPSPLRDRRADVPTHVDAAVQCALAKTREARWESAEAFAEALRGGRPGRGVVAVRARRGPWIRWSAVAAVVLAAGGFGTVAASPGAPAQLRDWIRGEAALDTMRYAILPTRLEGRVDAPFVLDVLLHEAIGRWREIDLVDRLQIADATARADQDGLLDGGEARSVARRVGAGRYVHAAAVRVGDSVRVSATLHRTGRWSAPALRRAEVRVMAGGVPPAAAVAELARGLLFDDPAGVDLSPSIGSSSLAAVREYGLGHAALERWDLEEADSLFHASVALDPRFALANLWAAQTRDWSGLPPSEWGVQAGRALQGRAVLPDRERLLAEGLASLQAEDFPAACAAYDALRDRDEGDFAAWYGLGRCRSEDDVVVSDAGSPTRWRFRASHNEALSAYRRAFEEIPSSHRGFRGGGFARVGQLFFTRSDHLVLGRSLEPEGGYFTGWATWQGDTLAVVPYPLGTEPEPHTQVAALFNQRKAFHEVALHWARAFPASADAFHALAVALDMQGDRTALDTLRKARDLLPPGDHGVAIAATEVWLRVKLSIPDDPAGLEPARLLADSLVGLEPGSAEDARTLSELAVLIGRPARAAALARAGARDETAIVFRPAAVMREALALRAFAAAGAPRDSLRRADERAEEAIRLAIDPSQRAEARLILLELSALLAAPVHRLRLLDDEPILRAALVRAQAALARGDSGAVRALLARRAEERRGKPAEDVTIDAVFAEAGLMAATGDSAGAAAWLDAALSALRGVQPGVLDESGRSGALVRAMALRAELARDLGDPEAAATWAAFVLGLWREGEEEAVGPLTREMARLASRAAGKHDRSRPPS